MSSYPHHQPPPAYDNQNQQYGTPMQPMYVPQQHPQIIVEQPGNILINLIN